MIKEKLKSIMFILILGSICTAMLLGIKAYTFPIIAHLKEMNFKATVLASAGISYREENLAEVFTNNIKEVRNKDFIYYLSPDNFYIFTFYGRGLHGIIEGLVTLNFDFETIEAIRIISHHETPGLGSRITEASFLSQFKKKKASPKLLLALRRKADEINEIDGISGATITSGALIKMINESVENFRNIVKG